MSNLTSRTITGGLMLAVGLGLVIASPFVKFITLIHGIPLVILGFFILLNTKEDKIEQIRRKK